MAKFFIFIFILIFNTATSVSAKELWLTNISVKELNKLYQSVNYTGFEDKTWLMIPSYKYPAIFLKKFPTDFYKITDEKERNSLFIKILAPLTLKLNQDLLEERQLILDIQKDFETNSKLSNTQIQLIEEKSTKYDVFTRLENEQRYNFLIKELLKRIDIIPPSIMITIASIETNFGASRILKEGNSLYKILIWHSKEGLKPLGEKQDDSYRIKTYPDIYQSLKDFALKINSSPNFNFLRTTRYHSRKMSSSSHIQGSTISAFAFKNSELHNYAGIIDYTLSYYELSVIDKSTLHDESITPTIEKKYAKYITKK